MGTALMRKHPPGGCRRHQTSNAIGIRKATHFFLDLLDGRTAAWAEGMLYSFVTCAHMLLHLCSMWKQPFIVHSNETQVRPEMVVYGWVVCTT